MEIRLCRILATAGPVHYRLAVAPSCTIEPYGEVLALLGLRRNICPVVPDAADRQLGLVALDLSERGFGEPVIARHIHPPRG